nr:nuclear transport factor 2 family protein [Mycolicibacterium hodleri]
MNPSALTLGETPISADQRLAAMELVARFEQAVDRRDGAALASLFTEDGCITGLMQARRTDLVDFVHVDRGGPPLAHLTANHVVYSDGPDVMQIDYVLLVLALDEGAPRILRINRITDDLVSTQHGWQVRRHDVKPFSADDTETR